jgi:hypothetical protein
MAKRRKRKSTRRRRRNPGALLVNPSRRRRRRRNPRRVHHRRRRNPRRVHHRRRRRNPGVGDMVRGGISSVALAAIPATLGSVAFSFIDAKFLGPYGTTVRNIAKLVFAALLGTVGRKWLGKTGSQVAMGAVIGTVGAEFGYKLAGGMVTTSAKESVGALILQAANDGNMRNELGALVDASGTASARPRSSRQRIRRSHAGQRPAGLRGSFGRVGLRRRRVRSSSGANRCDESGLVNGDHQRPTKTTEARGTGPPHRSGEHIMNWSAVKQSAISRFLDRSAPFLNGGSLGIINESTEEIVDGLKRRGQVKLHMAGATPNALASWARRLRPRRPPRARAASRTTTCTAPAAFRPAP